MKIFVISAPKYCCMPIDKKIREIQVFENPSVTCNYSYRYQQFFSQWVFHWICYYLFRQFEKVPAKCILKSPADVREILRKSEKNVHTCATGTVLSYLPFFSFSPSYVHSYLGCIVSVVNRILCSDALKGRKGLENSISCPTA